MTYIKKIVPVKWFCHTPYHIRFIDDNKPEIAFESRIIECSKKAVFNDRFGWICNCGRWVKDNDEYHKIRLYEERDVYEY